MRLRNLLGRAAIAMAAVVGVVLAFQSQAQAARGLLGVQIVDTGNQVFIN